MLVLVLRDVSFRSGVGQKYTNTYVISEDHISQHSFRCNVKYAASKAVAALCTSEG